MRAAGRSDKDTDEFDDYDDDSKSVELLYDIAKKLLDDQNKDSDTVTTRAGVVFGFSTLIAGSAGTVLGTLGAGSLLQLSVGAVIVTLYSVMAWNCASALLVRKFKSYPSPTKYKFLQKYSEAAARKRLLRLVAATWKRNSDGVMRTKARSLAAAIHALGSLLAVLVFATVLPYLASAIVRLADKFKLTDRQSFRLILGMVGLFAIVWSGVRAFWNRRSAGPNCR